jgi:uncharacterized protein (DUF2164 family)
MVKSPKFIFANEAEKNRALDTIISYFRHERGEEIDLIAAESLLDFFLENFGFSRGMFPNDTAVYFPNRRCRPW